MSTLANVDTFVSSGVLLLPVVQCDVIVEVESDWTPSVTLVMSPKCLFLFL